MRPNLRISIDDHAMLAREINTFPALQDFTIVPVSSNSKKGIQMSIHQKSGSSQDLRNKKSGGNDQMANPVNQAQHRYSQQTQANVRMVSESAAESVASNEQNRITFNREPPPIYSSHSATNLIKLDKINSKKLQFSGTSNLNTKKNSEKPGKKINKSSPIVAELEKAVEHLEQHNKNIMMETKATVDNFETYIQQLLAENMELHETVEELENYIQDLQNERDLSLEDQKQRELEIERIFRENMQYQKEILKLTQRQLLKNQNNTLVTNLNEQLRGLNCEVVEKRQMVRILEKFIEEKQDIIKKMTQFNNELCLQIMDLKANGLSFIDLETQAVKEKQNKNNKDQKQDASKLKEINENLEKKMEQMNQENQLLADQLSSQMSLVKCYLEQVTHLKSKLLKYEKQFVMTKQTSESTQNGKFNQGFEDESGPMFDFSAIISKGQQQEHHQESQDEFCPDLCIKKIVTLLDSLSAKAKSDGKKNYQWIVKNMMGTLRQLDEQANRTMHSNGKHKQKQKISKFDEVNGDSILKQLQDSKQQRSILQNKEILHKIQQINQRVRNQIQTGNGKTVNLKEVVSKYESNKKKRRIQVEDGDREVNEGKNRDYFDEM